MRRQGVSWKKYVKNSESSSEVKRVQVDDGAIRRNSILNRIKNKTGKDRILNNKRKGSNKGKISRQLKAAKRLSDMHTIGVAGLCDSAGTTQLCVMLATFVSGVLKKKTAVIGDEDYELMLRQMPRIRPVCHRGYGSRHAYSVYGVDYYCGMQEDYINMLKSGYDIIIQDINLNNTHDTLARTITRFAGCDIRILTGSMLPWKSKECEKKIERIDRFLKVKGLKMVTLTMSSKESASVIEKYGVTIIPMPFERNPFVISSTNLQSYLELLEIM